MITSKMLKSGKKIQKWRGAGKTFHTKVICRSVEALEKIAVELGGIIVDHKEKNPPCILEVTTAFLVSMKFQARKK